MAFLFSILGFFLVRSGVISSVHSFATDPTRGIAMLVIFFILMIYALILIMKKPYKGQGRYPQEGRSFLAHDNLIFINNIFLLTLAATILLGTLYPIVTDVLTGYKISVGEPYYNKIYIPITFLMIFFMVFAPFVTAKGVKNSRKKLIIISFIFSAIIAAAISYKYSQLISIRLALGIFLGFWLIISTLPIIISNLTLKIKTSPKYFAMLIGHFGFGVLVLSISFHYLLTQNKLVNIAQGDEVYMEGYLFENTKSEIGVKENYIYKKHDIKVTESDNLIEVLSPERRVYSPSSKRTNEAAVNYGIWHDIYLVPGSSSLATQEDNNKPVFKIYINYFMSFIWLGAILIALSAIAGLRKNRNV